MRAEKRIIFVGDVHGCNEELEELIALCGYKPEEDRLIFLGDVFNRGPGSLKVFLNMKNWQAESVLGNHEMAILNSSRAGDTSSKWYHKIHDEFGEYYNEMLEAIESWPLFIEEKDFIALHGGIIPGKQLHEMSEKEITTLRMWKDPANENAPARPWYHYYQGEKPVIFGHWAKQEGIDEPNAIGIDTGCVYGKALTALIWPEKKRVTVPAKKVYYPIQ